MGASALGDDLWSLTTFLSRYENGSDPISRKTASIAGDANMDLTAGESIDIAASVNLNATDLVCDTEFLYLCVVLSKGDAVNPDYTLEGVGAFGDLQVCQPFACRGRSMAVSRLLLSAARSPIINAMKIYYLLLNEDNNDDNQTCQPVRFLEANTTVRFSSI